MRAAFKREYQFARLLTRMWWLVGNATAPHTDDHRTEAARRQAPNGFRCLLARQKYRDIYGKEDRGFYLFKGENGRWFAGRPCKYIKRRLP